MVEGEYLCWLDGISGKEDRGREGPELEQREGWVHRSKRWNIRRPEGHSELE
jgi:hypothetical protein